jgi:hypothetical protein
MLVIAMPSASIFLFLKAPLVLTKLGAVSMETKLEHKTYY